MTDKLVLDIGREGMADRIAAELGLRGMPQDALQRGHSWVLHAGHTNAMPVYAWTRLRHLRQIEGGTNQQLRIIQEVLESWMKHRTITAPWSFVVAGDATINPNRLRTFRKRLQEQWRKRMPRIAELAADPPAGEARSKGLYVFLLDDSHAIVSTAWEQNGGWRMRSDETAPSRAYLKLEEALLCMPMQPGVGDLAYDLGAAPGGWTWSLARRGCHVKAVDNGRLDDRLVRLENVEYLARDALTLHPKPPGRWMVCDMIARPSHTVDLLQRWIGNQWCTRFVCTIKTGRDDPLKWIEALLYGEALGRQLPYLQARHLYHNRDEFTLMGSLTKN